MGPDADNPLATLATYLRSPTPPPPDLEMLIGFSGMKGCNTFLSYAELSHTLMEP